MGKTKIILFFVGVLLVTSVSHSEMQEEGGDDGSSGGGDPTPAVSGGNTSGSSGAAVSASDTEGTPLLDPLTSRVFTSQADSV